jgi:hypothetical protein
LLFTKAKKKGVGTKAQFRAMRERERRIATAIFLSIILVAVALSAYFTYSIFYSSSGEDVLPTPTAQFKPTILNPELKTAIVDLLSLTEPNQTFTQTAAALLTKANYTVDYYGGEKVTVNFYRNLPTGGYKLIILRVHSALGNHGQPPLVLFTSEPVDSSRYINEQLTDQLKAVVFSPYKTGDKMYFGIPPNFVRLSMKGNFSNSLIIAMGCNGLTYTDIAEAFMEKGAKAYVSWNGSVSASYTDEATTQFLQHLVNDGRTIQQAVEATIKEVGPDPAYDSILEYYPLGSGGYTI